MESTAVNGAPCTLTHPPPGCVRLNGLLFENGGIVTPLKRAQLPGATLPFVSGPRWDVPC